MEIRIDNLEAVAWDAWEHSKENKETSTTKQVGNVTTEATTRLECQSGNPAFLEMVLKCIDRRCRLMGLDAKNEPVTPEDNRLRDISIVVQYRDPVPLLPIVDSEGRILSGDYQNGTD